LNQEGANRRIIKDTFVRFASLAGLMLMVILTVSVLNGLINVMVFNTLQDGAFFPMLDRLLSSPMAGAAFLLQISELVLMSFWIAALLYVLDQTRQGDRPAYGRVMKNGFLSWGTVIIFVFMTVFIVQGPAYILGVTHGIVNWAIYLLMGWMVLAILILVWRYALVLPVYVIEAPGILTAFKRGAALSAGRRAEIILITFVLLFLAVVVSTWFDSLSGRLIIQLNMPQYLLMGIAAVSSSLIKWLLYSLLVIAMYLIYEEQGYEGH